MNRMTFGFTFKGNLHDFLPDLAGIYETVLFKISTNSFFGDEQSLLPCI